MIASLLIGALGIGLSFIPSLVLRVILLVLVFAGIILSIIQVFKSIKTEMSKKILGILSVLLNISALVVVLFFLAGSLVSPEVFLAPESFQFYEEFQDEFDDFEATIDYDYYERYPIEDDIEAELDIDDDDYYEFDDFFNFEGSLNEETE